jgi:Clathrin adaptor complex small chain
MIFLFGIASISGKLRLLKNFTDLSCNFFLQKLADFHKKDEKREKIVRDLVGLINLRSKNSPSFFREKDLFPFEVKVIYRISSSLIYFSVVDEFESELAILDIMQVRTFHFLLLTFSSISSQNHLH